MKNMDPWKQGLGHPYFDAWWGSWFCCQTLGCTPSQEFPEYLNDTASVFQPALSSPDFILVSVYSHISYTGILNLREPVMNWNSETRQLVQTKAHFISRTLIKSKMLLKSYFPTCSLILELRFQADRLVSRMWDQTSQLPLDRQVLFKSHPTGVSEGVSTLNAFTYFRVKEFASHLCLLCSALEISCYYQSFPRIMLPGTLQFWRVSL